MIDKMTSEIDEVLKRVHSSNKSVVGTIVVDNEGSIIKSTLNESNEITQSYGNTIVQIVERANLALKENDELTFLKIRTKKNEFIVVPDKDYMLITVINPTNESSA